MARKFTILRANSIDRRGEIIATLAVREHVSQSLLQGGQGQASSVPLYISCIGA